jgi:hypothetical protein
MEMKGIREVIRPPRLGFPLPTVSTPHFHLPRFCHLIITSPVHVSEETFRISINGE